MKKLKLNIEKTQKPPTQIELICQKSVQKKALLYTMKAKVEPLSHLREVVEISGLWISGLIHSFFGPLIVLKRTLGGTANGALKSLRMSGVNLASYTQFEVGKPH